MGGGGPQPIYYNGQQTTSTSFHSYVCGSVNWYIISAAATTLQSCIERGARSSTGYASNCSQSYSPFDFITTVAYVRPIIVSSFNNVLQSCLNMHYLIMICIHV